MFTSCVLAPRTAPGLLTELRQLAFTDRLTPKTSHATQQFARHIGSLEWPVSRVYPLVPAPVYPLLTPGRYCVSNVIEGLYVTRRLTYSFIIWLRPIPVLFLQIRRPRIFTPPFREH